MKILVLIKYSMDVAEIKVDSVTHELRLSGVPKKIGNIDKNVVEAAVQIKEANNGTIQAITLGPTEAQDGFREVLAMGVDEVFLLEDPFSGEADAVAVVRALEAAVQKLGLFDLILCGFASDDGYTFQVAPRLAERLNLPLVSYVRRLQVDDGCLNATRELDDTLQVVSVPLPVVVSIAEEAFPPRRTTLMDALKAKKKPVHIWQLEEVGLNTSELGSESAVESANRIGVVVHRKRQLLKGKPVEELADQLIDALIAEDVLKGEN